MKYWSRIISLIMVMVICFSFVCSSVGAANINFISNDSKIDSYLSKKLETASSNELIPVHIWYKDIDQNLVEQSVEKECGFTKEEIAIDYEMPSVELIISYKNGDVNAKAQMSSYMQRTEKQRIKERERTDEYIVTRREVSRIKYNEKSQKISKSIDIPEDRIIFRSEYAPTLIANLTKSEIERLNKDNRIESIGYYVPFECVDTDATEDLLDNIIALEKGVSGIIQTNDTLGLTGDGVKIGMLESSCPDVSHESINNADIICRNDSSGNDHSTNVARIMVGDTDGISKDATLYSVQNSYTYANSKTFDFEQFEWLVSQGVSVINISYGTTPNYDPLTFSYTFSEKWIDHLVAYHNVTVVTSAGNSNNPSARVSYPGLAHNVITVGAYNTNLTLTKSDDYLEDYSCWANSGIVSDFEYVAIEKPDVIMPGDISNLDYVGLSLEELSQDDPEENSQRPIYRIGCGTSFATPFLTGSIALMLELKPSLSAFPQAIKAIVLASCHRKVEPSERNEPEETLEEGITERQGAGVPDVWTMACIISQGTYGVAVLDGQQKTHRFYQPNYGATKMNVSLCWIRENYRINEGTTDNTISIGPYINLDLYVNYDEEQHTSLKSNSSTEMAYFDLDAVNDVYEMTVKRNSDYTYAVRYGYAYSTNETYFAPISNDGIYKIKNLLTDEYLTLDASNSEVTMQEYSDLNSKQDWILKTNSSSICNISSAFESTQGYIGFGDVYDNYSKKIELVDEARNYTLFNWNNMSDNQSYGAFRFYTRTGSSEWYIGCDNDNAVLSTNISLLLSSYWVLEKQNYRLGDVNLDGTIDSNDKMLVQSYLDNTNSLNNKQLFLADVDRDGTITQQDALQIAMIYS